MSERTSGVMSHSSRGSWSVVIVSYNTCALTARCVASVLASRLDQSPQVIVVDNASADDTVRGLQNTRPAIDLVCNQENVGFARAVNQALARAQNDNVLLLNPDAFLQPDTLANLASVLDANPRIGAVGPWLTGTDGKVQHHCASHQLTVWGQLAWHYRVARAYSRPLLGRPCGPCGARETQRLSGAALAFPRALLATVGSFDERFFMYYEDADFVARIRAAGYIIACATDVRVVHQQGASSQQNPSARARRAVDAELAYFRKHASPMEHGLLRIGLACNAGARAASVDLLWSLRSRNLQRLRDDFAVIRRCLRREA